MPFADNQGTKIYWDKQGTDEQGTDEQGTGAPVLLVMGLGYPSSMWHRTRPVLSASYRTIAFDNRGVGRSDVPPGPYSIAVMASDAAAVLDASGIPTAHVFGVSMGGMIAQEFALQYPSRVQSLILGCTAAGGPNAHRAEPAALEMLRATSPDEPRTSNRSRHPLYLRPCYAPAFDRRRYGPARALASPIGQVIWRNCRPSSGGNRSAACPASRLRPS